jgi:ribosomal protein S18 acetylase RimI-like enzyme
VTEAVSHRRQAAVRPEVSSPAPRGKTPATNRARPIRFPPRPQGRLCCTPHVWVRDGATHRQAPLNVFTIDPYTPADFSVLVGFVSAIQEHERMTVPELKSGREIGDQYATSLVHTVQEQSGVLLLAKDKGEPLGFVCAWIATDPDPLVQDEAREHAYVSDIFVTDARRREGVAHALLAAAEAAFLAKGCRHVRVCSKATNRVAIKFYESCGFGPYEVIFSKELK